ncbi:BcII family subclass B1 metallo-beta-lactamase [Rhabdobacter roseus]|uniref:Beta-lactamase n=1 Tax=Rhabdobacter roseus TaxID=1655419 RepID=A0A840TMF8_9BACT|nr:subclass B1 metallo-beta-lactamase [Rhabdobacter roseus]MBB5284115.1 metallo-beta-lactamase class B [Rhabdobacter roseus]
MPKLPLLLGLALVISAYLVSPAVAQSYTSPTLVVEKLKNNVYRHTTFLQTESFGKVPCNGMVVVDKKEAIVFDTPGQDSTSAELLDWIKSTLGCRVVAVIPTHFHADCLGGLAEFHRRGIPSYAGHATIRAAAAEKYVVPQRGFDNVLELKVGRKKVILEFPGEGHTRDNTIGYFPSEKVLFGGCLIKEVDASKGYLGDANVAAWPATVAKLKAKYPDVQVVIPGHGQPGGTALLDYTIQLFEPK